MSEKSFNAEGSTVVAFETSDGGPRAFGASVLGDRCGVYGESSTSPIGPRPPLNARPFNRTGVFGRGDEIGVMGEGPTGVRAVGTDEGVRAFSGKTGALAAGKEWGLDARGVQAGVQAQGVFSGLVATGHVGITSEGKHVRDLAVEETPGHFVDEPAELARAETVGIVATGDVGIRAKGKTGLEVQAINVGVDVRADDFAVQAFGYIGIRAQGAEIGLEAAGTSPTARGAVLSGGELSSPLRLMPSTNPSLPLHHGQRGDFFVDSTGGLYFCTDDAKPGTPAQWRKIAFEP